MLSLPDLHSRRTPKSLGNKATNKLLQSIVEFKTYLLFFLAAIIANTDLCLISITVAIICDLVFIGEFPSVEKVMQASVAVSKLTNIAFTTAPAVSIEEFDKLVAET